VRHDRWGVNEVERSRATSTHPVTAFRFELEKEQMDQREMDNLVKS